MNYAPMSGAPAKCLVGARWPRHPAGGLLDKPRRARVSIAYKFPFGRSAFDHDVSVELEPVWLRSSAHPSPFSGIEMFTIIAH